MNSTRYTLISLLILNLIKDLVASQANYGLPAWVENNANFIVLVLIILSAVLQFLEIKGVTKPKIKKPVLPTVSLYDLIGIMINLMAGLFVSAILVLILVFIIGIFSSSELRLGYLIFIFLSFAAIWMLSPIRLFQVRD